MRTFFLSRPDLPFIRQFLLVLLVVVLPLVVLQLPLSVSARAEAPSADTAGGLRIEHLTMNQELPENTVTCILQDSHGFIWFGTKRGLRRYDGTSFYVVRHADADGASLANDSVTALCEDREQRLWIGTAGGGVNRIDEATGVMSRIANGGREAGSTIGSICADRGGTLWCGTAGGLLRLVPGSGELTPFADSSIGKQEVVSIIEDSSGHIWIGTRRSGVACIQKDGAPATCYRHDPARPSSLAGNQVSALCAGRNGGLWVSTSDGGLSFYDPATDGFRKPGTPGASADLHDGGGADLNPGGPIVEDRAGTLWIGSSLGLVRFNPENGATTSVELGSGRRNTPSAPLVSALFEDRSGLLWAASAGGGAEKIVIRTPLSGKYLPPVVITDFMIFDNSNKNFVQGRELFDSVEISYEVNFFAFGFSAFDYREPRSNRYAFMLEGYDKEWTYIQGNHYARFSNVPAGSYVFHAKGAGADGIWNERGASVHLIILPPYWRTPWFYALAAAAAAGALLSLNRYRVRNQLRRLTELERVRTAENRRVRQRAADDFHDEFGHNLTKISLLSQVMKRAVAEGQRVQIEQLDKIIQTSEELSMGMRDFLWTLNPEKESAADIAIRLKDFGDDLFNGLGIAFRAHGTENGMEGIQLPVDWRRHLLLIFKEAMNNAAKHSSCRNATLEFRHENGMLVVRLADDGKGFDPGAPAPGQGLAGMKKRAEKLHADLKIDSAHGTAVEFAGTLPGAPSSRHAGERGTA